MTPNPTRITVLLPHDLKEKIEAAAAENLRSVSAEAQARLQASFAPEKRRAKDKSASS